MGTYSRVGHMCTKFAYSVIELAASNAALPSPKIATFCPAKPSPFGARFS